MALIWSRAARSSSGFSWQDLGACFTNCMTSSALNIVSPFRLRTSNFLNEFLKPHPLTRPAGFVSGHPRFAIRHRPFRVWESVFSVRV